MIDDGAYIDQTIGQQQGRMFEAGVYRGMFEGHRVQGVENDVHPNNLVVEFIVTGGRREERVPVCDEQIEDVDDLC